MKANNVSLLAGLIGLSVTLFILSCSLSDSDRCAEGYFYRDNACQKKRDSSTHTDAAVGDDHVASRSQDADTDDATEVADSGDQSDDPDAEESSIPTGLGIPCDTNGNECDGKDASYCAARFPSTSGNCTVRDCEPNPNNCPEGYICCDFVMTGFPFCVTEVDYQTMSPMCGGS